MSVQRELNLIDPSDVERELEQRHRDALLDVIMSWASLDGALGMMLARIARITPVEAATLVEKMPATALFAEMRRIMLRSPAAHAVEAARTLKKHKKSYERIAPIRNMIAHSHCAGYWRKYPDYVVFMTFQKVGDDALAVDAVNIHGMNRAALWARAMRELAQQIANVPYEGEAGR
jgi:hypothetical protein